MANLDRYAALKYRDFRLLWTGQFISNTGSQMQMVALNWHIYVLTNSAVALGVIGLVRFIPIVVFSLIGGSVVDAHNRKVILLWTQSCLAILAVILAATTFNGTINPLLIYIVTALAAAVMSFDTPARQAFIPNLVRREHITGAMSLNFIMFQTAIIIGPAIAGFLIGYLGLWQVYAINAVSFVAILVALLFIEHDGKIEGVRGTISVAAIIEGLAFVKSRTMIWSTMLLDFFSTFFASANVLLPIYAKDILQVGPQGLGLLYSAPSVGAVIAGVSIAHYSHRIKKPGVILLTAVGIFGLATIVFGLSRIFIISLIALAIIGVGDSISTIFRNTIRQLETPDSLRGRMTSINMIFFMGGPQLGEFEAGVLAALVGSSASVVIGGAGVLLVVGLTAFFVPALRKYVGHQEQPV